MADHSTSNRPSGNHEACVRLAGPWETPVPVILTEPEHSTTHAVILCHGFLSDKQSRTNRRLTELLVSEGLATLRFDWYGMGELREHFSGLTVERCMNQMDTIVDYLTGRGFSSLGLVGSSFGGYVTILAASRYPLLKAVGLKCPAVDFAECLRLELGAAGMAKWQNTNLFPDILQGQKDISLQYAFFEECQRYDGYREAARITVPTRVVHGGRDDLIPSHQIERLMQSLPGEKDLRILPEADHQFGRPEDFRIMTVLLAQWMIQQLKNSQRSTPGHESGPESRSTLKPENRLC